MASRHPAQLNGGTPVFGRNNVQGMLNSFRWGLDQRWHATTSSNGAEVRSAEQLTDPEAPPLMRLRGQDFSLDLPSRQMTAVLGGGQHGMDFNPWGDKFATSNSDHLQQIVGWHHTPRFQADLFQRAQTRRSIAADGPQAEVYRSSPVEPWRTLRTHLRLTGITPGVIEGGGRAAGYFTGATGVVIYTGDQWAPTESPLALVSDVGGNLVHRKRLTAEGLWWSGQRIDQETEILTSRDIWFRPVQLGMGPDGCLYMADMYREVIEHPASLPPLIKDQLDLTSGRDRGRIWRLRDTRRPIRRGSPGLDRMSEAELIACLDHPNGWHRQTAARLLAEQGGVQDVAAVRQRLASSLLPEGRLQLLAMLAQTPGGLDADSWQTAAADEHHRVRAWAAAWAAESDLPSQEPGLAQQLLSGWVQDPSLHVRWELALAAARWWPAAEARAANLISLMDGFWESSDLSIALEIGLPGAEDALLDRLLTDKPAASDETAPPPPRPLL
jgi:putative membrane-bound dehydrogenase-like protein